MKERITSYLNTYTEAAPLAVFRIFFGILMFISIIRFWSYGWIEKLYLQPRFHFSFYGFEWVKPLGTFTYLIFAVCALSTLFITLGYRYKWAITVFFLSFTYIELMDKTTYLNHYYFISLLSFLMIFLPANSYFSVDAKRSTRKPFSSVPRWTTDSIKLLLALVYIYAGLAKLNSDWLWDAMPLKIWLPSKFDVPILGAYMGEKWVHYAFSWIGAIYDLCIPFLLFWRRTRIAAFVLVVVFHVLTRVLFPIGMFPYIMIVSALVFFDANVHHKVLGWFSKWFRIHKKRFDTGLKLIMENKGVNQLKFAVIVLFFSIQVIMPWRYLLYPGELFWTEEGYRFSWRVMLMEKSGYAQFKIVDKDTQRWFYVDNTAYLTKFQEKQMSFQPDFILEYAHFLEKEYQKKGYKNIAIYVENYVALNGRLSRPYIDPNVDLTKEKESFKPKKWILPFNDVITGI
ncbi:HTTM domain-containing protein [Spongiimicrobium salis]|uniref:HTTM domain-containing protein n=1 Tax=Spongiimicrobium salis TaxID=1667022 RepID=UPI00374D84DF